MTPDPASGIGASSIGASSIGDGTIAPRLAELELELEEATRRWEYFQLVSAIIKTMTDQGIDELRNELISSADAAWDTWDYTAKCYAVDEFRRIGAIQLSRSVQADKDAGIDPYVSDSVIKPGRSFPDLPEYQPRDVSLIERESWGHKAYKFRHPIAISGDLMDLRCQLASTQPG